MRKLRKIDHRFFATLFTLAFVLTPFLFSLHVQHEDDDSHDCTLCLVVHQFQADLQHTPCTVSISPPPVSTAVLFESELRSFFLRTDQPIRAPPILT